MANYDVFVDAVRERAEFGANERNTLLPIILAAIEHPGNLGYLETAIADYEKLVAEQALSQAERLRVKAKSFDKRAKQLRKRADKLEE